MPVRYGIHRIFILLAVFALLAGCSSRLDPLAPEDPGLEEQDPGNLGDRSALDFEAVLQASLQASYTEISQFINGSLGGSFSGQVPGYSHSFSMSIPAGACQAFGAFKILVPNDGLPVYQLLPHMQFSQNVTIVLDYSKWLAEGTFSAGDSCELLYMNEETQEFEPLAPRVLFAADAVNPTVSFSTSHFSRWIIDDDTP